MSATSRAVQGMRYPAGPSPTRHPTSIRQRAAIASRVLAAIFGGWGFAWGFVVLCLATGRRAGLSYADAQTLAGLLVFFVYVGTVCATFAARSPWRVWVVLIGGGTAMTVAGGRLLGVPF